jgi:hypothetical protein
MSYFVCQTKLRRVGKVHLSERNAEGIDEVKGSAFRERDSSGTTEDAQAHLWCASVRQGDGADSPTRARRRCAKRLAL